MTDKIIYEEELRDWLPDKIFDFHIHLWKKQHLLNKLSKESRNLPGMNWEGFTFNDMLKRFNEILQNKTIEGLIFGFPVKEIDIDAVNKYISKHIKSNKGFYGLLIPSLTKNTEELKKEIECGGFSGFKPYLTFVKNKDKEKIRITDFVTKSQLEVADENKLIILLHIPRKDRLADKYNLGDINVICTKYPNAKIVLAHIGRSYGPYFLEKGIDEIKHLKNLYYDLAMVNDEAVIELLIEKVGAKKIIFGSDMPISLNKGKHICINRQCLFITKDKFPWSIPIEKLNCTYFIYETLRALKFACIRHKLSKNDMNRILYSNAKELVKNDR
jgi:predicted TIM-barrel fold metal-dependent hydrolase